MGLGIGTSWGVLAAIAPSSWAGHALSQHSFSAEFCRAGDLDFAGRASCNRAESVGVNSAAEWANEAAACIL